MDAIPAASLILVRDRPGAAPELLMAQRSAGMRMFAGALVFPGGRIDGSDEQLARALADPLAAARIAAIRETLEETAIPAGLAPVPGAELALELQRDLNSGESFAALLGRHRLTLRLGELAHLASWRPDHLTGTRFETHFFVARAPAGEWQPRVDPGECAGAEWLTGREALERAETGRAELIFPTRCMTARLARHRSHAAILRDLAEHPGTLVVPRVEWRDGERWVRIPDGFGFPLTEQRAPDGQAWIDPR